MFVMFSFQLQWRFNSWCIRYHKWIQPATDTIRRVSKHDRNHVIILLSLLQGLCLCELIASTAGEEPNSLQIHVLKRVLNRHLVNLQASPNSLDPQLLSVEGQNLFIPLEIRVADFTGPRLNIGLLGVFRMEKLI